MKSWHRTSPANSPNQLQQTHTQPYCMPSSVDKEPLDTIGEVQSKQTSNTGNSFSANSSSTNSRLSFQSSLVHPRMAEQTGSTSWSGHGRATRLNSRMGFQPPAFNPGMAYNDQVSRSSPSRAHMGSAMTGTEGPEMGVYMEDILVTPE